MAAGPPYCLSFLPLSRKESTVEAVAILGGERKNSTIARGLRPTPTHLVSALARELIRAG